MLEHLQIEIKSPVGGEAPYMLWKYHLISVRIAPCGISQHVIPDWDNRILLADPAAASGRRCQFWEWPCQQGWGQFWEWPCQQGRGQPSSFAAALRKASVSPVARRLWASHSMHLSTSACQLIDAARHREDEFCKPFRWSPWMILLGFIRPLFKMSRRTDMLSARTCALGWERQRIMGDRRHCKSYSVSNAVLWRMRQSRMLF